MDPRSFYKGIRESVYAGCWLRAACERSRCLDGAPWISPLDFAVGYSARTCAQVRREREWDTSRAAALLQHDASAARGDWYGGCDPRPDRASRIVRAGVPEIAVWRGRDGGDRGGGPGGGGRRFPPP